MSIKTVTHEIGMYLFVSTFAGALSRIAIGARVLLKFNTVCESNAQAVVFVEGEK